MRMTVFMVVAIAVTFVTAPVVAQGPGCGPDSRGACFITLPEGEAFILFDYSTDGDQDGDIDYILHFVDGFNDFLKVLPNGRVWAHGNEQQAAMIYCPFYPFEANGTFVEPNDTCVFGSGHQSTNGFIDDLLGLCPGTIELRGQGYRGSDGASFSFHGQWQAVSRGAGCVEHFRINDSMP